MASDPYFLHDFCFILNCHLDPIIQLFKNLYYLESVFFKELYLTDREAKNLFKIPLEHKDRFNFEFSHINLENDKLGNIQIGDNFEVGYFSKTGENASELMLKNYKVTKLISSEKDIHLSYYVKEKIKTKGSVGLKSDEIINQYDLSVIIKSVECKTMVYIKIEMHPSNHILSPFTKDFRIRLEESLITRSQESHFRKNYENLESIIIIAPRKEVFQIIDSLRVYKGCEVYYSTEIENPKIFIGRKFKVILHQLSSMLEFEIIDYHYSDDVNEDSRITGRLLNAEPEHVLFDYSFILKTINHNQQLVLFKHVFEEAISPELMKHHSQITISVLHALKILAELESKKESESTPS